METTKDLTLVAVDGAYPELAARALLRSARQLPVARVLLLTHLPVACEGVEVVPIRPLTSRAAYSEFMLRELGEHIQTSHALIVQWDGFVLDGRAFEEAFWACDYIGACWPHEPGPYKVGNGGFSWRSKRLYDALAQLDARPGRPDENEDATICVRLRPLLEERFGLIFADERLADRFSFEVNRALGPTFGFHGIFNFWQVLSPEELAEFARHAPAAIVRSQGYSALIRNLLDLQRTASARVLIDRAVSILDEAAVKPWRDRLAALERRNGNATTSFPAPSSRLAPCPCGSGRRYKDCHGAIHPPADSSTNPEADFQKALDLHSQGQVFPAMDRYKAILQQKPEHPGALHYLGVGLYQQGAPTVGMQAMWRSLKLMPNEPEWWSNYAAAAWAAGHYELGRKAAERALALDPDHAAALNNLGFNLRALGHLEDSLTAFDRALELDPDFAHARWNRSFSLLQLGRYEEGFADYELRERFPQTQPLGRIPDCPRWSGTPLSGKLLILAEQGLGDTLMFARFLPEVLASTSQVVLAVQVPLVELLQQHFPTIEVLPVGAHENQSFAAWCALWSLPALFKTRKTNLPGRTGYLKAPEERVAAWQARIQASRLGRPAVGLVWQGQFAGQDNEMADRSLPPHLVADWIRRQPEIAWFSLQWGAPALPVPGLIDLAPAIGPFSEAAAAMMALDLVISVDTASAHLAGALGKSCWVPLRYAGEWRYGNTGTRRRALPLV